MKKRNLKFFIIALFILSSVFIFPHTVKASGYDVCGNETGWSFPQSKAQTCGWGYYHSGSPKYGYVQDCCCCYLKSHIHDLGEIFQDKKVMIEYQPGWKKGCTDTMTIYASTDNQNWREISSHRVSQPTWNPKTTFQEKIDIYGQFRYIKIFIPHCYNDYSSARVINDLPPPEDPIEGTLSVSENSVCAGETATFTISAQDDQGIEKVCIKKESGPETCKFCNGQTSCTKNITTTETNPGTYKFSGVLYGKKTNGSQEIGTTNPQFIEINFTQCHDNHSYKQCYDNDVYWYDSCGNREDIFQDCGESEWTDEYKCSGNIVQRKWQNAGCENAQCSLDEEWKDFEDCSQEGKICQNGQCVTENNHPTSGTLSASKTSLNVGENVNITIEGLDDDGLENLCLFYENDWHCQNVSGNSSSYTWTITESSAGQYSYCGKVKGKTADNNIETSDTNPSCITINFNNNSCPSCSGNYYYYYYQNPNNHLGCYDNDVYWFDQYGSRRDKYQECGESYYSNWSQPYCKGNQVYESRTYYQKGCDSNACYDKTQTEEKLIKTCSDNQVCENGECKIKASSNVCTSGPCCENGQYKSVNSACNVQFQTIYGCPWGTGCGYDVGKKTRSRVRYCSGISAQCDGQWGNWGPWTPWQVSDYCSYYEACSVGKSICQASSSCSIPSSYIKHYSKKCYKDKLYWIDSNGTTQDLYRDCSDNNSCTTDNCQNGKCINDLHCDGSTCKIGSDDYCSSCNHCSDGICNCQETENSCLQDCLLPSSCISGFVKPEGSNKEWEDTLKINEGDKLDFLFSVCNSGDDPQDNVGFKISLPDGVSFQDNVYIDGEKKDNVNLTSGLNLGTIPPHSKKSVTFSGKVEKIKNKNALAAGIITVNGKEKSGYIKLIAPATSLSLLASAINKISFWKWVLWFLIIAGIIFAIFIIIFAANYFMEKRDEKHKQMILEGIGKKK